MTEENMRSFSTLYMAATPHYKKGRRLYHLTQELRYHSKTLGLITVPRGFITDRTSVPRWLTPIFPVDHRYLEAAVVHDWMYDNCIESKKVADDIFEEGMIALGVKKWRVKIMMAFVRLVGKGNYGKFPSRPLNK